MQLINYTFYMASVLNKSIIQIVIALLIQCSLFGQKMDSYELKESALVHKCFLSNKFKTLTASTDLGELSVLNFEYLTSEIINDSLIISFILWDCPYHSQIDREKVFKDCQCNNILYDFHTVKVINEFQSKIGKPLVEGVYKSENTIRQFSCVNQKNSIKLKLKDEYNLIFEISKNKALYVRIANVEKIYDN